MNERNSYPPPPVGLPETEAAREQRRKLGQKALIALCGLLRGARSYSWEHEAFTPLLDSLQRAILELLGTDGTFELDSTGNAFRINGEQIEPEAATVPLASALRTELHNRGVSAIRASLAPPKNDLRRRPEEVAP